jgi:hypothetical protein
MPRPPRSAFLESYALLFLALAFFWNLWDLSALRRAFLVVTVLVSAGSSLTA